MLWRTFSEGYLNIAFVKYVVSEIRYCYHRTDRSGYFKKLILQHLRQIVKGRMLNVGGAFSKRHHQEDGSSESLSSGNEF